MVKIAQHFVNCIYCKERFNRDKNPFVQVSARRYAHADCYEKEQKKEAEKNKYKNQLEEYIKQLFDLEKLTPKINKQIKDFINPNGQYGYSYNQIYKTLFYFYSIQKNSIEKSKGGIGIVPFVYEDAFNYYRAIWEANQINAQKPKINYTEIEQQVIKIKPPQKQVRKRNLFDFLDLEEEI